MRAIADCGRVRCPAVIIFFHATLLIALGAVRPYQCRTPHLSLGVLHLKLRVCVVRIIAAAIIARRRVNRFEDIKAVRQHAASCVPSKPCILCPSSCNVSFEGILIDENCSHLAKDLHPASTRIDGHILTWHLTLADLSLAPRVHAITSWMLDVELQSWRTS